MFHYTVTIHWSEEDNAFIAEVPDLPGCMADGKTYSEAIQNLETIMNMWIETANKLNRPIPTPIVKV
jgi:predicted RNase H-like HicB family nuclease